MCTKPSFYSSGIKLIKLVYSPTKPAFSENSSNKLFVFWKCFNIKKPFFFSLSWNFMLLCVLLKDLRKNCACSVLENKTKESNILFEKKYCSCYKFSFRTNISHYFPFVIMTVVDWFPKIFETTLLQKIRG